MHLVPLVFETAGRWGESAARELRRLARARASRGTRIAVDVDAIYRATLLRWRRELSTLLQQANASVVMAAVGCVVDLQVAGVTQDVYDLVPEAH